MNSDFGKKHVIHFNPSRLAELETPHAQASWAQKSCCAGQAMRARAASSPRLRQGLGEGPRDRAQNNTPRGYQSLGGHTAALRLALHLSQDLISLHPLPQRIRAWSAASHMLSLRGTGEACHCACPGEGGAAVGPTTLTSRSAQALAESRGIGPGSAVWGQEVFPFRPDRVVVILSHFCCARTCSPSLSMPFLFPSNRYS